MTDRDRFRKLFFRTLCNRKKFLLNRKIYTYTKISNRRSFSPKHAELGHFRLLLRFTEDGKEMIHNAPAKLLFYSLNMLFGGVLVAVAVVICLSFLITDFDNDLRFQAIFKQNYRLDRDSSEAIVSEEECKPRVSCCTRPAFSACVTAACQHSA